MTEIKCVIGANFGDEGKGLMTDFFADKAIKNNKTCLVVLSNGGAQRGHTVTEEDGKRHVFQHFGSGTLVGAHTYLPQEYIVNPMIFRYEWDNLFNDWEISPKVYIHGDNLCTTPFDSMLNMMIEDSRGNNRHGSCGVGIWETIVRDGISIGFIKDISILSLKNYLINIRDDYVPNRLKQLGMEIPSEWKDLLKSDGIIDSYIDDLAFMIEHCEFIDSEEDLFNKYDTVIFENGQGLLLDKDIDGYGDNTTPSSTGVKIPAQYINTYGKNAEIEVCYVSRSYMTRHGAGRFDTECDKSDLNSEMFDSTNTPNIYQGTLRYGYLDVDDLIDRCLKDFNSQIDLLGNAGISIAITHLDDYYVKSVLNNKLVRYVSYGPHRLNVSDNYPEEDGDERILYNK